MELDIPTLMMIFFVIALVISIWKIYVFLPDRTLADDDRTEASESELIELMLKAIKNSSKVPILSELYEAIENDEGFDKKHYWRFNQNRLNQLLNHYYSLNNDLNSIEDIYKSV
ncbi:MAG: hypothetical protein GQ570_02460 [Helicobacteraceae bacterium]|nr:hypothetical protein [Helicobacteraceae bacterium]